MPLPLLAGCCSIVGLLFACTSGEEIVDGSEAVAQSRVVNEVRRFGDMETFGSIDDIAIDQFGRLMVADRMQNAVHVFDAETTPEFSFGSKGEGPGEFLFNTTITVAGDRTLIGDQGTGRLDAYSVKPLSASHVESYSFDPRTVDMCAIGDRLFATGLFTEGLVRWFDLGSGESGWFGTIPAEDPRLRRFRAPSRILCVASSRQVWVASESFPRFWRFSENGTLLEDRLLSTFVPADYEAVGSNGVSQGVGDEGFSHHTMALGSIPPSTPILAVWRSEGGPGVGRHQFVVVTPEGDDLLDLPLPDDARPVAWSGANLLLRADTPFPSIIEVSVNWSDLHEVR